MQSKESYGKNLQDLIKFISSGEKPATPDADIEALDRIISDIKQRPEVTTTYMRQWERELSLQYEAAEKTRKDDGLEIIRFGREYGISDEKIRSRLSNNLRLSEDIVDELFKQADEEIALNK